MVGLRMDRLAALPATFTTGQAELLAQFTVDGRTRPIRRTARAGTQIYTVSLGKQADSSSRGGEGVLYLSHAGAAERTLVYLDITKKSTEGLRVELWYGDCGIKYVNVLDMIVNSTQARVARTPDTVPKQDRHSVTHSFWLTTIIWLDSSLSRPVVKCENLAAGDIATLRYVTACGLLFYQSLRPLQEVSYCWHLNVRLQLVVEITNASDAQSRV